MSSLSLRHFLSCVTHARPSTPVLTQRAAANAHSRHRHYSEYGAGSQQPSRSSPETIGSKPPPVPPPVPPPTPQRPWWRRKAEKTDEDDENDYLGVLFPFLQSSGSVLKTALGVGVGLGTVFVGGSFYLDWYKAKVLDQMEKAFEAGNDPVLTLANFKGKTKSHHETVVDDEMETEEPWTQHLRRREQDTIDNIVQGTEPGHYFMLLGPKGCGKGTMIIDAMNRIDAEGVSMVEAHPDLEVFRLRLGKALNYEYNEDSQTGVFQRRDPREGGPCLDIERALNKLEKVAMRCSERQKRPLVMVFNNVHYFNNDENGRNLLLQLQQKAESWAQSGCMTVVFSSDDSWPYFFLRKTGSRMQTISITDLNDREAIHAARRIHTVSGRPAESEDAYRSIVASVGGRLSYLKKVARAKDMDAAAARLVTHEKGWLLSQIGLIPDHDDDVMDEQKWSSCSWLLLREFVRMRQDQEKDMQEKVASGELKEEDVVLTLPTIPYWKCRVVMTRPDFLEELDRLNIINIDVHHDVRPDSMLILHAARQVCEEAGFDDTLDAVRDRVDAIESLHRTRELTMKDVEVDDLVRLVRIIGGKPPNGGEKSV